LSWDTVPHTANGFRCIKKTYSVPHWDEICYIPRVPPKLNALAFHFVKYGLSWSWWSQFLSKTTRI